MTERAMDTGEVAAMSPTFTEQFAARRAIVEAGVADLNGVLQAEGDQYGPYGRFAAEQFAALMGVDNEEDKQGPKRTRGVLTVTGYEAFGGDPHDGIAGPASAIAEIVHTYLLVIDDGDDRSPKRRGKPTMHVQMSTLLQQLTSNHEDVRHVSERWASLQALTAQHRAQALVMQLPVSGDRRALASYVLNDTLARTGYAQQLDLLSIVRGDVTFEEAKMIAIGKTAFYSVLYPLQKGAALAGARPEQLSAFEPYARAAGLAFQEKDDLLGLFGDPAETGKSNKSDLMEGKWTMLFITALQAADPDQQQILRSAHGNKRLTDEHFAACQDIIRSTGVYDSMLIDAESYARQAVQEIGRLATELPLQHVRFLQDMAMYGVQRTK